MFDTYVTIQGNVLTAPEWRRTERTKALVAHFKVASTARRWDKDAGNWVDGDSLRVRVSCWRRLAEGVASSVMVGDPVVVFGRIYTRDWTDADGLHRVTYELEASAVGHDLSRGRGTFARNRPAAATSEIDDDLEPPLGGEPTTAPGQVPAHPGQTFSAAPSAGVPLAGTRFDHPAAGSTSDTGLVDDLDDEEFDDQPATGPWAPAMA